MASNDNRSNLKKSKEELERIKKENEAKSKMKKKKNQKKYRVKGSVEMLLGSRVESIVFKSRSNTQKTTFTGRPLNKKGSSKSSRSGR